MGVSPLRLAAALAFGGMVTGGMYLMQHANGRTLPAVAAPAQPAAPPASRPAVAQTPKKPSAPQTSMPLTTAPKRIVFKHQEPGEVVLTVHGDELQVQFVPAAKPPVVKPPAAKPAIKAPAKISALPAKATPVATP